MQNLQEINDLPAAAKTRFWTRNKNCYMKQVNIEYPQVAQFRTARPKPHPKREMNHGFLGGRTRLIFVRKFCERNSIEKIKDNRLEG